MMSLLLIIDSAGAAICTESAEACISFVETHSSTRLHFKLELFR